MKTPPRTPTPFKPLDLRRVLFPRRVSKIETAPSLLGKEGKKK